MRALISTALVGVLAFLPGCTLFERAREDLNTMPEPDYLALVADVRAAGADGGMKLKDLIPNAKDQRLAHDVALALAATVRSDDLGNVDDVVRAVIVRLEAKVGSANLVEVLRDATNLIDAAVGQIRLGIDGVLTDREANLVANLLEGVADGLAS